MMFLLFFLFFFWVVGLNSLTLTILFSYYIWNLLVLINRGLFRKKIRGSPAKNPQLQLLARKRRAPGAPRPGRMVSMARKIFVGSLPQSITEDQLRQEFETYGEVEAIFIKDFLAN